MSEMHVGENTTENADGKDNGTAAGEPRRRASGIEIVERDDNPDTLSVKLSKAVAKAAIEDHFLDVVLPTLSQAFESERADTLIETDRILRQRLTADISELVDETLGEIVENEILKRGQFEPGLTIEIIDQAEGRVKHMRRQHMMFPVVLRLLSIRDRNGKPLNVALNGPAGNGKTSIALACAEALGISPVLQPFNPQTTKSELMGYMDANGEYVPSPFYDAFKNGKLFIADEFDAANPGIAVILNAAIANRMITFPNLETVKAHPNFRGVFIMNTMGTGADHQYTGRFRQDAATLDRLIQVHTPIDPDLESAIAGVRSRRFQEIDIEKGGRFSGNAEILHMVQQVRLAVQELRLKYIVSPRATLHATAMHAGGFGKELIMECCIWRGMPEQDKVAIQRFLREPDPNQRRPRR